MTPPMDPITLSPKSATICSIEEDDRRTIYSPSHTLPSVENTKSIPKEQQSSSSPSSRSRWMFPGLCGSEGHTVDPRSYSRTKKYTILLIVATAGAISPIASTIYFPAIIDMQDYFQTDATTINASLSVFTFVTAVFPLMWATLGEIFGRRRIYLAAFLIALIGTVCCAISINVGMFIAFRAFSAIGSSCVMSMGAGTISDIFEPSERGRAFAWYTCGPLLGPALGPIVGGYLNQGLGWRSTLWFLAIYIACIWLAVFFLLPETWRPAPSLPTSKNDFEKPEIEMAKQQQQQKKQRRGWINPLSPLELFKFPNISLAIIFVGFVFFVFYLNSTAFTRTYTDQYHLDSGTVGLCYLPLAVGAMIGGIMGGRYSDKLYNGRVQKAEGGELYPEMRLGGWLFWGSIILQLLSFVEYGWCTQMNVHWAYGLVGQFFAGLALMVPNVIISAYIVDCFRRRGASVTACNNFARYIMAGIGSLVTSELQEALGNGILFTIWGAILALASTTLMVIIWKGKKWAEKRKDFI
ncbi:hypothetical protein EC973_005148 [Apophysomyces ossiformis]|uniref:Major facilitator superfamily (MFS) profile domain-containing protein n=1 Tax=Apophysomyces ossiformis TaxID=679940 RepID=A0A8H7BF63_9FUNG|nr:hypothetical protein EC973_005148 [Apophysomyces ossiformis]